MFFEKLRCGNAEAEKVWDDYLKYLAIAINNLRMTFDCDIIAGGYVGAFLEEFARELKIMLLNEIHLKVMPIF